MAVEFPDLKVGFLGGGNIGKAIGKGLAKNGLVNPSNIYVSTPTEKTFPDWKAINANTMHDNTKLIANSDIIFLCVKPYQLDTALSSIQFDSNEKNSKLFVSVISGTTLDALYNKLTSQVQKSPRLIRAMPNTPVLVGEGATVISPHKSAKTEDTEIVRRIFLGTGKCEIVSESLISPIIGIAGSSPAFIYVIIEAMADGGVKQGLPRDLALTFSAQAVLGAAKMVLETGLHPGQLKDAVCSPSGTTIYGIHKMEKAGVRGAIIDTVEATTLRSEEMAQKYK